jgi:hypothetical protein
MDQADEQIVLEEELDENYEPTDQGEARLGLTGEHGAPGQRPAARRAATDPPLHPALGGCPRAAAPPSPTASLHTAEILDYANWLGMDVEKERVRKRGAA